MSVDVRERIFIFDSWFTFEGTNYEYDDFTDRYYRLETPSGFHTKLAREGGLAKKRISKKHFFEMKDKAYREIKLRPYMKGAVK